MNEECLSSQGKCIVYSILDTLIGWHPSELQQSQPAIYIQTIVQQSIFVHESNRPARILAIAKFQKNALNPKNKCYKNTSFSVIYATML